MGSFLSAGAQSTEEEEREDRIITEKLKGRTEISVLKPSDFQIKDWVADGGYGSVFRARCKAGKCASQSVALKFFGYTENNPSIDYIEDEIIGDWELNNLACTAKVLGYFFDTKAGLVADRKREDLSNGSLSTGKQWPGCYPVKVSQCLDKDILTALQERVAFSERDASKVFKNIIESIDEIHRAGIIHRDLNPQNIMFEFDPQDSKDPHRLEIKLVDFGFATKHASSTELPCKGGKVGTSGYNAPETEGRKVHSRKTDVWQAGVTLFVLIFQRLPFKNDDDLNKDSSSFTRQLPELRKMKRLSEGGIQLLSSIFVPDPTKRPTCAQILAHPWIRNYAELPEDDYGPEFREAIKQWVYRRNIRKAFNDRYSWSRMVRRNLDVLLLSREEKIVEISISTFLNLKKNFLKIAPSEATREKTSTKGGINYEQFCKILQASRLNNLCSRDIFGVFDMDKSDKVDYFEFLLALSSYRKDSPQETDEEQAKFYFEVFDINDDGFIDRYVMSINTSILLYYASIRF